MTKDKEPPTILVGHASDGRWMVFSPDFPAFVDALGVDVVAGFAACYVHANSLTSYAGMFNFSRSRSGKPASQIRDFLAFHLLTTGILRELSIALKRLRELLESRGLHDSTAWPNGLGVWEEYGTSKATEVMRHKGAFHLDLPTLVKGLRSIARNNPRFQLFQSDGPTLQDAACTFAFEGLKEGLRLQLRIESFDELVEDRRKYLHVIAPLDEEFRRVISACRIATEEAPWADEKR